MTESKIHEAKYFTIYETTNGTNSKEPIISIHMDERGYCNLSIFTDKIAIHQSNAYSLPENS